MTYPAVWVEEHPSIPSFFATNSYIIVKRCNILLPLWLRCLVGIFRTHRPQESVHVLLWKKTYQQAWGCHSLEAWVLGHGGGFNMGHQLSRWTPKLGNRIISNRQQKRMLWYCNGFRENLEETEETMVLTSKYQGFLHFPAVSGSQNALLRIVAGHITEQWIFTGQANSKQFTKRLNQPYMPNLTIQFCVSSMNPKPINMPYIWLDLKNHRGGRMVHNDQICCFDEWLWMYSYEHILPRPCCELWDVGWQS